jgi:glycosyl transferase family 25
MPSELPPIWVVSLARATDRREFVERAFADAGLPFEIFPAVDGRELAPADVAAYSSRRAMYEYGDELGPGILGCALSHLRVLERMVAEGIPELVVFEDDARPDSRLRDVLLARKALPPDYDVVTFHSLFGWAAAEPVSSEPLVDAFHVCEYQRTPMGTQAYLITRRAAERVLEVGYPVALPSDELLFRAHPAGLRVYGIEPTLVVHEEFPSEIRAAAPPIATHGPAARAALQVVRLSGKARRRIARTRPRADSVASKG